MVTSVSDGEFLKGRKHVDTKRENAFYTLNTYEWNGK